MASSVQFFCPKRINISSTSGISSRDDKSRDRLLESSIFSFIRSSSFSYSALSRALWAASFLLSFQPKTEKEKDIFNISFFHLWSGELYADSQFGIFKSFVWSRKRFFFEQSYHNCIVSLKGKQDNGGTWKDLRPLYIYLFNINDNDVGCLYDQAFLKSRVTWRKNMVP